MGIGKPDPDRNPFLRTELPTLRTLLAGRLPTTEEPEVEGVGAIAFPLDATLGISGLPQSGTGQIALLTGRNAPRLFGRHFGPWPPVRLRPLLAEENLLSRARAGNFEVAFANAYPREYPGALGTRRTAAPPLAAKAAGLLTRHHEALSAGDAVATGILNEAWRTRLGFADVPRISAEEAGANLAAIANRHDLTMYAHYATDLAGHRGGTEGAVRALERVDLFLAGVLGALGPDVLLMIGSDHGNVEDLSVGHTRNAALGLIAAPEGSRKRGAVRRLRSGLERISDVPAAILDHLTALRERAGGS